MNVLIVGGSQGIGLGFVEYFLQQKRSEYQGSGYVFATYRSESSAQTLINLARTSSDSSAKLKPILLDVTNELAFIRGVAEVQTWVQSLDLVIYCVGILHEPGLLPEKSLKDVNSENLVRYFQVNSIGGILLAKHVLPLLKHKKRNVLAFISARVGSIEDNRLGGWYGYRASKAALNMLIKTTSIEYARKSPHTLVCCLHPGTTDTQLSQPFQRNVPSEKLFSVERTVRQLVQVLEQVHETGQFYAWDGSVIPW